MIHTWKTHISVANPENGVVHLIRNTGHALIFLTEHWRWRETAAYRDALKHCTAAFEQNRSHEDARDAFLAALVSARLTHDAFGTCFRDHRVTSCG